MKKLFIGIVAAALLALGAASALAALTIYPQSNAGEPPVGARVTVGLTIKEYVEVVFGEPNHNLVIDSFSPGASAIADQVQIPLSLSSNCNVNLRVQEGLGYELYTKLGIPYAHFWMYPDNTSGYLASPNCSLAYADYPGSWAASNGGENDLLPGTLGQYGNFSGKLFELGQVVTASDGSPHSSGFVYEGTVALQARVDIRVDTNYSVGDWDWTDIRPQDDLSFYVWAIVSSAS